MAALALGALAPPLNAQADPRLEMLLQLQHEHRAAHVLRATERLMSSFADSQLDIAGGTLRYRSRTENEARFRAYLHSVRFLEWEDVIPPVINLSADSTLAVVAVEKRVRYLVEAGEQIIREGAARYAWVETWGWDDERWQLVGIASTDGPEPDAAEVPLARRIEAYEILHAARAAAGGPAAVAEVAMVSFDATVEGPRENLTTHVRSARDGRFMFRQSRPQRPTFEAGISLRGAWRRVGGGPASDSIAPAELAILRAHELHLLAIAPESRFSSPRVVGRERIAGHEAHVVRFLDADGHFVEFFYRMDTALALGFRLPDLSSASSAPVVTLFDDWRSVGSVRLPFSIEIRQGEEIFRYRITNASSEWLSDNTFRPTPSAH